jgi:TatD DNase family protein
MPLALCCAPSRLRKPPAVVDLVDIGLNLTHESFTADRNAVLERAAAAHVTRMLVTGSSVSNSRAALALARQHPGQLRATAGIHPHHASECNAATRGDLLALLRQPEVLAVGECGLDYFRNFSTPADQEKAFRLQLGIAAEVRKPVFLHQRDAHEPFIAMLTEHIADVPGGVAHCFTAGRDEARAYLDLGLHIGITGWLCDERRGLHLREVVRFVPADRLLVETDAPYLLPRDLRPHPKSRRNEPCYLPHIVAAIASYRGESVAAVAEFTTRNAVSLFSWS